MKVPDTLIRWCGILPRRLPPAGSRRTALVWLAWSLAAVGSESSPVGTPPQNVRIIPATQCVLVGTDAAFTVTADSTLTLSYQWFFKGKAIPGATEPVLVLPGVDPSQAGAYTARASNTLGAAGSTNSGQLTLRFAHNQFDPEPIVIPDRGPERAVPAFIEVANVSGTLERVSVVLWNLAHPSPDDLDLALVGPRGQSVWLMSDAGNGYGVDLPVLEFSDDAPTMLPDEHRILPGRYRPANYPPDESFPAGGASGFAPGLGVFTNGTPNGTWALQVADDTVEHEGAIEGGWGLDLEVRLPEENVFWVQLHPEIETRAAGTLPSGSGLLRLNANGVVDYNIELVGLNDPVREAFLLGPAPDGTSNVPLFPLDYAPAVPASGSLRGSLRQYLGPQLWDLRRGLHSVEVHLGGFPEIELRGPIVPLPLPIIQEAPQSQAAQAGDEVVFHVLATNSVPLPLTYQWRRNGRPMLDATNQTLRLANVRPADSGHYDVVVGNAAGGMTSGAAQLTVARVCQLELIPAPLGSRGSRAFDNSGPNQEGHSTPCGWTGTSACWFAIVPEGEGQLIVDTEGSAIATLLTVYAGTNPANVQYLDCDVNSGVAGQSEWASITSAADLGFAFEVDGLDARQGPIRLNWRFGWEPVIQSPPTNQTVPLGANATLAVQATGVPPPHYQWQFNDRDIPQATNAMLTLSNVTAEAAGAYRVVVSNFMNTVRSDAAQLTVFRPVLLEKPVFETNTFRFHISGAPNARIIIEASPDLRQWSPIWTNRAPDGVVDFSDPEAGRLPRRFYRAVISLMAP